MQIAQATGAPDSGASNSEDFQPPTGSPQTAPANLFQQQGGLQNTDSSNLLNDGSVRISVPSGTGSSSRQVKGASTAGELSLTPFFIALAVAAAAILLIVAISIKKSRPATTLIELEPEKEKSGKSAELPIEQIALEPPNPKKSKKTARRSRKKKRSKH